MLIEPTESESLSEIDRFCDAMIKIRAEAEEVATGKQPRGNNIITNAPHPISVLTTAEWDRFVPSLFLHLTILVHGLAS
jgi:glycine dehydrogenase